MRPLLFRPDVVGDSNWIDGSFDAGWLDHDKKFGYTHTANKGGDQLWVNTDLVNQGEIKTFADLLDPMWKGKIELQDPRVSGDSFVFLTALRLNLGSQGDELMRKLLVDQQPIIATDPRNTVERLIRGAVAIASGPRTDTLLPFKQQGLTDKLFLLRLPETAFKQVSSGLWFINKAPHPNATKLFVNWACTQEGSSAYVRNLITNSRRTDVDPGDPAPQLDPKATYKTTMITEDSLEAIDQTKKLAMQMLS
jgi:ABC-type Fe3+ transport system substrate-binding protein